MGVAKVAYASAPRALPPPTPKFKTPVTADICARTPTYTPAERAAKMARIRRKLAAQDAVLVAHYYTHEDLQQLAEETGGTVADSLEMARFGQAATAATLVVAGVRFMGETAKILSPEKRVLMPAPEAECSLDLGCPPERFAAFCDAHPDRTVVVYANTSAAVKARADWVATSRIALELISHLMDEDRRILWAPDKYLGAYLQKMSGADMLLWNGSCVVHEEFKYRGVLELRRRHPDAAVLAHPESPAAVLEIADRVGSTTALIKAAAELPNKRLIVATDNRIFYKMRQAAPDKILIEAPTAGEGATCRSCAHCPWMAMNDLDKLEKALDNGHGEITLDEDIRRRALQATQKMIDFANARGRA